VLVPGQHAVLALLARAGLAVPVPLSARLRHPDVPRLSGLDRAVADRQRGGRTLSDAGRFHAVGCGNGRSRPRADDVVCTQYRDRDRRADPRKAAASVRRGSAVQLELHDYDHLRRAARTHHVGEPHAVSHASAVRPHGRLGRSGAPRSRGAMVARLPAVLAPNLDRASAGVAARSCCTVRHSLCLAHRGRPAALDPARGGDRRARARTRPDRGWARPTAGGDIAATRIARARAACDRAVAACIISRSCARPGTGLGTLPGEPSGASRVPCEFIPAAARTVRRWSVFTAGSWRRATSSSISVRMSATASPSYAAWARAWWRSSRSLRWSRRWNSFTAAAARS